MKKLFIYLKNYKKAAVLSPLFKLFEATLELLVPLMVASMIDDGILPGDRGHIIKMATLMAVSGFVGLAFSVTAQYFAAKASVGFASAIRKALFDKIQTFSYTRLDNAGTSTLITRLTSDIDQVQTAMNLTLRLLLRSPFVVFGAAVMAFTVDSSSGGASTVFGVVIPLLSLVVFGIMLVCIPLYHLVRVALDGVLGKTRENINGVRVIRAFRREEGEIAEFDAKNEDLTRFQKFTGRISAIMNPATFFIVNIGIIALIYKGALRVDAGLLTQGAVVALYNYMSQILVELIKLANLIITVSKGVACGNRVQAVLETDTGEALTSEKYENDGGENAIEFRNVTFRYDGAGGDSLCGISFSIKKGETLGIIGGTGSGKTTLVNLIPRFYRAKEGDIFVGGRNVNGIEEKELREKIGIVPQKATLFSGTVRENLAWRKPNADDAELNRALASAQALDFINSRPEGLDSRVEQNGRNFSGGQRQRLTIARALVGNPEILILDDSASALDLATEASLRTALKEGASDRATVIVSQRTASILHADKILVLDEGRQVGLGTHDELLENCGVYKEIYDSQFASH